MVNLWVDYSLEMSVGVTVAPDSVLMRDADQMSEPLSSSANVFVQF